MIAFGHQPADKSPEQGDDKRYAESRALKIIPAKDGQRKGGYSADDESPQQPARHPHCRGAGDGEGLV